MEFIEKWLPLIVAVREGGFDAQELDQMSAGFERYFQRAEPYAVLNVSRLGATAIDAHGRLRIARWANLPRVRRFSKELCAGSSTVVALPWERHALSALLGVWTPVAPHRAVSTIGEGLAFCVARLIARGARLPEPSASFQVQVQRGLEAIPLQGLLNCPESPALASVSTAELTAASAAARRLDTLSDAEGSARVGWIADNILWTQLDGRLSADLGARYTARLHRLMTAQRWLRYFIDGSRLEGYDLRARDAVARVLVEHADRVVSCLVLSWTGGISPIGHALLSRFRGRMRLVRDRDEFEKELLLATPSARALVTGTGTDPSRSDPDARTRDD